MSMIRVEQIKYDLRSEENFISDTENCDKTTKAHWLEDTKTVRIADGEIFFSFMCLLYTLNLIDKSIDMIL